MATGHTIPPSRGRLLVTETLNVRGRGLSPSSRGVNDDDKDLSNRSSTQTSLSEEDDSYNHSEEYTVLDGVRDMNHMLVKQIETLRLKIQIDEKNYNVSKQVILEEKNSKINSKETEIEDLRDSINDRDDRIQSLEKASREKDRNIQSQCQEIEGLKQLINQTKEYARNLHQKVGRVRSQSGALEDDPLYKQQNEEISKLTGELDLLRTRLSTMEQELQRAMHVIEQQNDKMKAMTEEKVAMHAQFKDDLEVASKAMRQQVERMREVMGQNYEEMKILREQNRQMTNDVRDIKELLKQKVAANMDDAIDEYEQSDVYRYTTHRYGQPKAILPKGRSGMAGGNVVKHTSSFRTPSQVNPRQHQDLYIGSNMRRQPTMIRETTSPIKSVRSPNKTTDRVRSSITTSMSDNQPETNRGSLSPDRISRPMVGHKDSSKGTEYARPGSSRQNTSHPNVPSHNTRDDSKAFPPICTFKEGNGIPNRQPSARGAKAAVRKGSAVRR